MNGKRAREGVYVDDDGRAYVYEAVEPVKATPLQQWIERGEEGRFVAKRLRDAEEVTVYER